MVGSQSNVAAAWTGAVLQGTTSKALAGGALAITRIDTAAGIVVARVRLTAQQVEANTNVVFAPPKP